MNPFEKPPKGTTPALHPAEKRRKGKKIVKIPRGSAALVRSESTDDWNDFPMTAPIRDRKKELEQAKAEALKTLAPYSDEQRLVAIVPGVDKPFESTAGELRKTVSNMEDPAKGYLHGLPHMVFIESLDPEAFFKEQEQHLEQTKQSYLNDLAGYSNDQDVWIVYPNDAMRPPCLTNVGRYREMLNNFDWELSEDLSHLGGFRVVSTDPNFDPEMYMKTSAEYHHELVKGILDGINLKDEMISNLERHDPKEWFRVAFAGDAKPQFMTRDELINEIEAMNVQSLKDRGVPSVVPVASKEISSAKLLKKK